MKKRLSLLVAFLVLANFAGGCNKASDSPKAEASPQAETATASPKSVEPIPGWKKIEGNDVELWLPESYSGGDPSGDDLDLIVGKLESLGPNFAGMAETIKQNPGIFKLWAFESKAGSSGFVTNVNVANEQIPSTMTVETYLQAASSQLPSQFKVLEQSPISLKAHPEAGKLVAEMQMNNITVKQLMYVIKNESQIWVIGFSTGLEDFEQRLPEFEQSIETFRATQ